MNLPMAIDPDFTNYALHMGYFEIFPGFITVDQFTPIPEEGTLLTICYLSNQHVFNQVLAMGICL